MDIWSMSHVYLLTHLQAVNVVAVDTPMSEIQGVQFTIQNGRLPTLDVQARKDENDSLILYRYVLEKFGWRRMEDDAEWRTNDVLSQE